MRDWSGQDVRIDCTSSESRKYVLKGIQERHKEEKLQVKAWENGCMAKIKERELMEVSVRLHWSWRKANNKTWVTGFLGRSSLDVHGDCWQRSWCRDCGGQHFFPLMCRVWDKWWDIQVKMTYERYSTPNARPMATGLIPNLFALITVSLRICWQFWSNQFDWVPGRHEPTTSRFFTPTTGCSWGRQTARVTCPGVKIFTF